MILSSAASGRERTDRPWTKCLCCRSADHSGILKGGNHLRLCASGMAMNQRLAVIALRNRQARSLVLMRWAFSYPVTTNPVATKG